MASQPDDDGTAADAAVPESGAGSPPTDDDLLEAAALAEEDPAEVLDAGDPDPSGDQASAADLASERDDFREVAQRVKAEFENYRKRVERDRQAERARAAEGLVSQLLPVLDACEAAINHGEVGVEPIHKQLLDVLEREGLQVLVPVDEPYDAVAHQAAIHEEGDGTDELVVVETLRTGYSWNGRVLREAMVKVRG